MPSTYYNTALPPDLRVLKEEIEAHARADSPERRRARARAQILSLAQTQLRSHADLDRLAELVADGRSDPYTAAEQLFAIPAKP